MPDAAVIIPHYQDHARLARCLAALAPQLDGDVEVVVVDNASPEPPRPEHPGVRVVTERQKGAANARNRGVAETTAERIFFLDCDCVPADDWLETARRVAPRADLVGGTVSVFDETPPPRSGAEVFETVFAFDNRGYVERKGFSVTANLLVTRAAFEATGGFVDGTSEDLDWCRRATARGFKLVHAEALRVAHPTRADWPALRKKWRRLTDEMWQVERGESRMARPRWALKALAMPASVAVHAPKVVRQTHGWRDRGAGLTTLARLRLTRMGWMLAQATRGR